VRVLHEHIQNPGLLVFFSVGRDAPLNRNLLAVLGRVLDLFNGRQTCPRVEFGHIFSLAVSLQFEEHCLGHHDADVHHLPPHLFFHCPRGVPAFDGHHLLFLAGEHAALTVAHPEKHVVVQTQVEPTYYFVGWLFASVEVLADEVRNLFDQLRQVHRRHPLRLALRKDVLQQVASVGQGRQSEAGLGHY